jgi:glutaminyl-peptide cyclotransferase
MAEPVGPSTASSPAVIARAWLAAFIAVFACLSFSATASAAVPVYGYQIVHIYPHDKTAFTEGLFYLNGYLYESTGPYPRSQIRKEQLTTAKVVQSLDLTPANLFGEGIVNWKGRLIQLTWQTQVGFVYDLATFKPIRRFSYPGEGWALTQNGHELVMSDGTPNIRFLNPESLKETHRIAVTLDGHPIQRLNELEWVKGELLANIWMTNYIARINPATGVVDDVIDLTGLLPASDQSGDRDDVPNGIAYDSKSDRLFVTGKRWPKLFEIRLVKTGQVADFSGG